LLEERNRVGAKDRMAALAVEATVPDRGTQPNVEVIGI